jgi:hypothetical protein
LGWLLSHAYKGFPNFSSAVIVLSHCRFPDPNPIHVALLALCEKVKDCETTTGHVGHLARTLMKDARRGLNR